MLRTVLASSKGKLPKRKIVRTSEIKPIMDGVFAINKPSGVTSASFLDEIKRVFTKAECFQESLQAMRKSMVASSKNKKLKKFDRIKVKMGHGGTLDPLASGILVVGIGAGTKKLQEYTNGSVKVYETVALLGGSTTTGDSEGDLLSKEETDHIDKELLEKTREKFVGTLTQTPPIFSALKMNGMPLYEYARKGLPLPRNIKAREVTVYDFNIHDDSLSTDHEYVFLKNAVDADGVDATAKFSSNPTLNDHVVTFSAEYMERAKNDESLSTEPEKVRELKDLTKYDDESYRAPIVHFTTKVSSGTYIRSLISDFGRACGSSAYMTKLIRSQQAEWSLDNCFELSDFKDNSEEVWQPVLRKVLEQGTKVDIKKELEESRRIQQEKKFLSEADEARKETAEETPLTATEEAENKQSEDEPVIKKRKLDASEASV